MKKPRRRRRSHLERKIEKLAQRVPRACLALVLAIAIDKTALLTGSRKSP